MVIYNRYIITVSILLLLTAVILIALGIDSLEIHLTTYIIEALIVTELYRHLMPRARPGLNIVSIILLAGFLVMVALRVIKILA